MAPAIRVSAGPYAARPWLQHYDDWVPRHIAYPERPLHEILDAAAADVPENAAIAFCGATLTFRDVKQQSDRLATALGRLGIAKGDRVGVMLPNCPQYVIAVFAILRHGAAVVNLNPTYTAREMSALAADSGLRLLITLDTLAPLALEIHRQTPRLETVIATSLTEYAAASAKAPRIDGTLALTTLIDEVSTPDVIRADIAADDLAVLQYTGGTTGQPKGAMLSHRNIFANVIQMDAFLHATRSRGGERTLVVIPYFHIYAFTVGMMMGTWTGALQILLPKYDADDVLRAIRDLQPTFFPAVPTIFVSLLGHPRITEFGLDKVARFNSGGAPCPLDVIDRWERTTGRPLYEGFGLSETSPVTHSTPERATRKPGTIGLPLPDTDIRIVDLDTGKRDVALGEAGELCIAGPQVMQGYWNRPDETASALRADAGGRVWFHTGDVARMDEDGFTSIVQRKKDMIIVDGFNVYPSEVEAVVCAHPSVRLVAVVGIPDSYHGEIVKACVVLKEGSTATAADLAAHCWLSLAPYKVPQRFEIRGELPMSAVGKVLYRVLREEQVSAAARSKSGPR